MTFTNPVAWYLLFLAVPIILFYILKIRLRQVPVSTVIFWQQVFEERRSRSFWRRLRHLISLILSLLFLFLLIGSVLNPVFVSQKTPARCVIIVDNSAGMNAVTDSRGTSRLDLVKNQLNRLLATNTIARQTAIITAGGTPQIIVGFTDHAGTLRRSIELIKPTDYATKLTAAAELAEQLIDSEEDSLIWIYTDGCVTDLADLTEKPNIKFFPVGSPADNIGVTKFQPRRSFGDTVGYEVLIEMVNFGTESVDAELELKLENKLVDVISCKLEPNQPQTKIAANIGAKGGLLQATLKLAAKPAAKQTAKPTVKPTAKPAENFVDVFPTDNIVVAFLPELSTQHVYVFGTENFFLRKVLQSQPNVELHFLSAIPDRVPDGGILVLHQTVPATIPAGKVLILDPRNSCDLFEVGEEIEVPMIAGEDSASPFLKFVHLTNLMITGSRKLTFLNRNTEILAETPETFPIYAYCDNILVLTADLTRSDLALRTAFPILVSQALLQFRGGGGELEKTYSTDEPVRLELKTTDKQITLISPSGFSQQFPVKSDTVSLGMLPECGVWTILGEVTEQIRIACNLSNISESNLRLAPETFYAQQHTQTSNYTNYILFQTAQPIWFWLTIIALLLCVTEWFLYQRRWID
ncbi:MAG: BatA and WFA domain-containing protein [Planctomycetaceae bacterium]|jgi:hypothetical protein|nr:BatA and WFA domain-containing protein [Planctomycetaceae bacterium]